MKKFAPKENKTKSEIIDIPPFFNETEEDIINDISTGFQLVVDNINGKKHSPYYTEKDFEKLFKKHLENAKKMGLTKK